MGSGGREQPKRQEGGRGALRGCAHLFCRRKRLSHRLLGLLYLLQLAAAVTLYCHDFERYLASPLVWTLPLNAVVQSANAALLFRFLPRKDDPGFSAVSDKSVLSYYTVVENSFYAGQLLFACCILQPDIRARIQRLVLVEPTLTFFPFYLRHLWPSSRITAALGNSEKNMSDANRLTLTVSAYAIKVRPHPPAHRLWELTHMLADRCSTSSRSTSSGSFRSISRSWTA